MTDMNFESLVRGLMLHHNVTEEAARKAVGDYLSKHGDDLLEQIKAQMKTGAKVLSSHGYTFGLVAQPGIPSEPMEIKLVTDRVVIMGHDGIVGTVPELEPGEQITETFTAVMRNGLTGEVLDEITKTYVYPPPQSFIDLAILIRGGAVVKYYSSEPGEIDVYDYYEMDGIQLNEDDHKGLYWLVSHAFEMAAEDEDDNPFKIINLDEHWQQLVLKEQS